MNQKQDNFYEWMKEHKSHLSEKSLDKYTGAVKTISNLMKQKDLIQNELFDMNLSELDIALKSIFSDPQFIQKNTTGRHMYSCALQEFRCFVVDTKSEVEMLIHDVQNILDDSTLEKTEKEVLTKARIGQGEFREKLMKKYAGRCAITGLGVKACLIASHIKPWAVSTNDERLSEDNGLILSASYDKLFDKGLISFENDGKLRISLLVNSEDRRILSLEEGRIFPIRVTKAMKVNLEYHRDIVFVPH